MAARQLRVRMGVTVLTWDLMNFFVSAPMVTQEIDVRSETIPVMQVLVETVNSFCRVEAEAEMFIAHTQLKFDQYENGPLAVKLNSGATCVQTGTNDDDFTCRCIPGFIGRLCDISMTELLFSKNFMTFLSDENNCLVNLCQNGGQCIDGLNNFDCQCQEGFAAS